MNYIDLPQTNDHPLNMALRYDQQGVWAEVFVAAVCNPTLAIQQGNGGRRCFRGSDEGHRGAWWFGPRIPDVHYADPLKTGSLYSQGFPVA